MRPTEFERRYHAIRVSYTDQQGFANSRVVDVHIYRQTSATATFPEKDAILSALDKELRQAGGLALIDVDRSHRVMIARAFYGKGSPDDCAVTLRHAVRYRRTEPDRLQHYCDNVAQIGLDCSGFVNNFFRAAGTIQQDRDISEYGRGTARDALDQMQPNDALVFTDAQGNVLAHPRAHIALLENTPDAQGRAVVVESASSLGGLTHSNYTFTRVGRNLFQVRRPSGSSHVRVVLVR